MDKTVVRGGDKKRLGEYVSGFYRLTFVAVILASMSALKYNNSQFAQQSTL